MKRIMYNVLVVDDEPLVRLTLKNLLDWEAFDFFFEYEAAHGRQALEIVLSDTAIDIIILDMTMPVMDGLELIEHLRLLDRKPEILILSSHNDFPLVRKAFKLGIHDYVLKSEMEPDILLSHLQAIARRLKKIPQTTSQLSPFERKYLRRQFLKELLRGEVTQEASARARQFDIRLCDRCLCIAVLAIQSFDLVKQRYQPDQLHIFVDNVSNAITQVLNRQPYGEVVSIEDDRFAIFFSCDEKPSCYVPRVYDTIREVEQALIQYFDVKIHYGVSTFGQGFSSIIALFQEAVAHITPESRIVKRTKRYVLEHFNDPELDLQEMSDYAGITKNHLSHQFSKETGENLRDYIHKVRIEEAKKLLLTTNLKVYEVCYEVGYKNVESFSRAFKKLSGVSPNKYSRKELV